MKTSTTLCLCQVLLFGAFILFLVTPASILGQTNANNKIPTNNTPFQYGVNPGYYGNGWSDSDLSDIAAAAGALSFRASLPGHFVEQWGYRIRVDEFNHYTGDLGMKGITVFLGEASENQVDQTVYPPATLRSKIFKNIYSPIWVQKNGETVVNETNAFAWYVYNVVNTYKDNVEYWEIVNEPDFTYFWDNGNRSLSNNWYDNQPSPKDLPNLNAPIFHYIRMLRIAYDVIKKYSPNSFVAPGGLGHPAFLDALLRYTDNPDNGKVTNDYPFKGGAYFDVLSFHTYPANNLSTWDNGRVWHRHSDAAVDEIFVLRDQFDDVLKNHGYNDNQYPAKPYIITEMNIPRKMFGDHYGGDVAQRNFIIKASVESQKNGIAQFYIYKLAESANYDQVTSAYELMGLYENLKRDKKGQQKMTQQGQALKTTYDLLYGWRYNDAYTKQLQLPSNIGGAAFQKGDDYRFVLWAKTSTDQSEDASATYSFPESFGFEKIHRYMWNHAVVSGGKTEINAENISLTGTPSFFEVSQRIKGMLPVVIVSFDTQLNLCDLTLNWNVTFDKNGNKIEIEESEDGKKFKTIYTTELKESNAKGKLDIKLSDDNVKYYRLVVKSQNGEPTYSEVKKIKPNCNSTQQNPEKETISIFPNPVIESLNITGLDKEHRIVIYDGFGRRLKEFDNGQELMQIDMTSLPASVYFLNIIDRYGSLIKSVKVLKN